MFLRLFARSPAQQSRRVALDLTADLARRDDDPRQLRGRLVKDRREQLLHPDRRTPAVDVARQRQQFLLVDHGHGLLAHGAGGLLQVKALRHGDVEDIVCPTRALGNERFEHARRIHAQPRRDGYAVHRAVRVVGVRCVGHLALVERAHDVGLFLFILCHNRSTPYNNYDKNCARSARTSMCTG